MYPTIGGEVPASSDQDARERHQPLRDAAGLHQLAGQNEERNREQRKVVDAPEHPAGDDPQWGALIKPQPHQCRGAEREGDRDAHDDEGSEQDERRRHFGSPRTSRMWTVGARMT